MQRLMERYSRLRSKIFPEHSELFARLAVGQKPQALFIACSDSRDAGDVDAVRAGGSLSMQECGEPGAAADGDDEWSCSDD